MKAGEKTINLLACIAFVLAAGLGIQAWELSKERQLTVAQTQSIQLSSMQLDGKPVPLQQGLQLQTVKISAVGDFYSLLRWLRQAERDGCKVKELRLHNDMQVEEILKMDISLEFHTTN